MNDSAAFSSASLPATEGQPSVLRDIFSRMSDAPDAIALTDGDLEWTYQTLRQQTDIVARSLANSGVTRGSVVGMHLPRCADAIAAMLGIMSSGCVYLPLDPSYPSARLRFMLDRAGAVAVMSGTDDPALCGSQRAWLPPPSQVIAEPRDWPEDLVGHAAAGESFGPDDCAYILFTSGSTGDPKGVMVTHENISLMNEWSAKTLGVTAFDSSATTCSLSFDASFHEILLPLSVGGTVHVIPHALALGQLGRPVSFVATTPRVASSLLDLGQLPRLKALMLGGEVLSPDVAERILTSGRVELLLNCYGPTECTVCVTVAEVTVPVPGVIPVGRPVPGTEVLILDEGGHRVADGEPGEICVFGRQVARGYINDPAGTAERFVVSEGSVADRRRYYRTGDLGHRTPGGVIYFAGRADRQVKVNGIRIELGEIDAALRSYPHVSDAATVARGEDRIVAYVAQAGRGAVIDPSDLRSYLSLRLPRFMLPSGIVVVAEIPRTVNGKLDTAALPEWSQGRPASADLPAGDIVDLAGYVYQVVADVTGFTGPLHPSDDVIDDLGGTSLDLLRVLAELERISGRRLRINDALADTSVAGLAGLVQGEAKSSVAPTDFAFNLDGGAPPLFMIHAYLGGMLGYRRIAELLPSDQPVYGLHAYGGTDPAGDRLTMSALAQDAVDRMRQVQPTGRITMLGHSAGGLIVFEAARRITAAGGPEPRVLLMDAPRPYGSLGYYWGESLLYWREIARHPVRAFRGATARLLQLAHHQNGPGPVPPESDDLMTLTQRNLVALDAAIRSYKPQAYSGSITVMRTRQGRLMSFGLRYLGWASVTRGTRELINVPGPHIQMLEEPYVRTVAKKLRDWLIE